MTLKGKEMRAEIPIVNHQRSYREQRGGTYYGVSSEATFAPYRIYEISGVIVPAEEDDLENANTLILTLAGNAGAIRFNSVVVEGVGIDYTIEAYAQEIMNFQKMVVGFFPVVRKEIENV
jgi:hypothetical protein